jgi:hypothetical protein
LKERDVEAHVVAFTHVAAQNAEGGTILHELYLHAPVAYFLSHRGAKYATGLRWLTFPV